MTKDDRPTCPYCKRKTETIWHVAISGPFTDNTRMCPGDVADMRRDGFTVVVGGALA